MLTTPIPVSGGSQHTQLLPTEFIYHPMPSDIKVEAHGFTFERLQVRELEEDSQEDFSLRMSRFSKFINYFAKIPYSKIKLESLHEAAQKCRQKFIGVDGFLNALTKNMIGFASKSRKSIPRGMLLYGPPGTGKSAISEQFISQLNCVMLNSKLSPGDFNQGIKGDTQRMMRGLQKRAKLIPWDVGFIIVDEIDSLVPNRQSSSTSNDQKQSIGTLFPIMDKVESFVIVGTTNFKNSIDDAYNRRVTENQYFLGVLNKTQRLEWPRIVAQKQGRLKNKIVKKFVESQIIEKLSKWTINFTPSIYQILLENFYDTIELNNISSLKEMMQILIEKIQMVSINFSPKIQLRGRPLMNYLLRQHNIFSQFLSLNNSNFVCDDEEQYKSIVYHTGRIFFDLSSKFQNDMIQIEQIFKEANVSSSLLTLRRNIRKCFDSKRLNWKVMKYFFDLDRTLMPKASFPAKNQKQRDLLQQLLYNPFQLEQIFPSQNQKIQMFFYKWLSDWRDLVSDNKSVKTMPLYRNDQVLQKKEVALSLILQFADSVNSDCVFIFDHNFFATCNSIAEQLTKLQGTLQYARHYDNYIMIFDMDSISTPIFDLSNFSTIAQVSSASSMKVLDETISYSKKYLQQELLQECFRVIQQRQRVEKNQNKWIIAITESVHLSMDFKERTQWPKSFNIKKYESEIDAKGVKRNCKRCGNLLSEIDIQKASDCWKHKEERGLYIQQKPKKNKKQNEKQNEEQKLQQQEISRIYSLEQVKGMFANQKKELNPNDIIWMCCRTSYSSKGCIQVKHQLEDLPINQY